MQRRLDLKYLARKRASEEHREEPRVLFPSPAEAGSSSRTSQGLPVLELAERPRIGKQVEKLQQLLERLADLAALQERVVARLEALQRGLPDFVSVLGVAKEDQDGFDDAGRVLRGAEIRQGEQVMLRLSKRSSDEPSPFVQCVRKFDDGRFVLAKARMAGFGDLAFAR